MSRAGKALLLLLAVFLAGMAFQWAISNLSVTIR